jgi:cytochrome c
MKNYLYKLMTFSLIFATPLPSQADEFTKKDLESWNNYYLDVVKKGDKIFHTGQGENKVSCDQCHPNAANTHPETYPKFQKQLGKVAMQWEMINWCLRNTAEMKKPWTADDPRMIAIQTYITHERRGVKLAPGKH